MPGTVLLLAASPVGKGCLVDAASVLPVLAAVSPAVLSGTDTANVVELADPLEPQAVLTRLRAAATAPGPLTMFVTGQLQLDRRQRLPHLALARTTPSTVRYTAFPWHWITEELRLRAPGTTELLVDLHADAETWEHLATSPLTAGTGVGLYGRVAPPPPRRTVASPAYMKALATILRSGLRPELPLLHQQSLARAEAESGPSGIVLAAPARIPVVPDPHAAITAAAQAGRRRRGRGTGRALGAGGGPHLGRRLRTGPALGGGPRGPGDARGRPGRQLPHLAGDRRTPAGRGPARRRPGRRVGRGPGPPPVGADPRLRPGRRTRLRAGRVEAARARTPTGRPRPRAAAPQQAPGAGVMLAFRARRAVGGGLPGHDQLVKMKYFQSPCVVEFTLSPDVPL